MQVLRPTQAAVQLDQDMASNISTNGAADYKSYDMSKVSFNLLFYLLFPARSPTFFHQPI